MERRRERAQIATLNKLQERADLAVKSIEALVGIATQLYLTYKDKLISASAERDNSKSDLYAYIDKLKLFKGTLMPFQKRGVGWLVNLYLHSINCILADEMGLGKTVQIIGFISYIIEKGVSGPFLIIVPLSVLPNWKNEFTKFAPDIPVITFHGNAKERKELILKYQRTKKKVLQKEMKPIIVTSFEGIVKELRFFQAWDWEYVIVDEGHRIKNSNAVLTKNMKTLRFRNCVLLTGTPLQNNLEELWSLLCFLFPDIFEEHEDFKWLLNLSDLEDNKKIIESDKIRHALASLHKVVEPFMLRRVKKDVLHDIVPKKEIDVYCGLSETQKRIYKDMIQRRLEQFKNTGITPELNLPKKRKCASLSKDYKLDSSNSEELSDEENEELYVAAKKRKTLNIESLQMKSESEFNGDERSCDSLDHYIDRSCGQSTFLRMKQVVDHPYLNQFPVTSDKRMVIDEHLVTESGKMLVLDKMLRKLKEQHHRVLIFSTTIMMLDLIEDFMVYRNHTYRRLDGSTPTEIRQENIDEFNKDESIFAFILSTRAGGLGINLTSADTVIFYDRDWNPQRDIQAQDRCHRIGQTKPVMVYTLIGKDTVDERIINTANAKRRLEKLVIQDEGKLAPLLVDSRETYVYLQTLLESANNSVQVTLDQGITDEILDQILDRSELYKELEKQKRKKQP